MKPIIKGSNSHDVDVSGSAGSRSAASPSDDELLFQARAGDRRSFSKLIERYESVVAATVVGMLGPCPEADDVGQETFIRFYRSISRFRGESSLATYLTRIAINQSLKALKRRKRDNTRQLSRDEADRHELYARGDANCDTDRLEQIKLVQSAVGELNPAHRSVVVLRMFNGYSTKETATILGIAPGTVMSRLSRALSKLETKLSPLISDG